MGLNKLVVDTSVVVKWLSQDNEKHLDKADKILKDAQQNKVLIITPELTKYEVGNVLLLAKHLTIDQARTVLSQLYKLPIIFIQETDATAIDTYRLAAESKITYYDASFMALAAEFDAKLVTDNIKHQGRNNKVNVIAIENY
jgi:predicted nucleic acid-binding protein